MVSRSTDARQCPMCGAWLEPPYDDGSSMWLLKHAVDKHLDTDGRMASKSGVHCCCGKYFRGTVTWTRHLARLTEDESTAHSLITASGAVSKLCRRRPEH